MLPIPVPPGFRIIAHRGASAYAPENTVAAFELAVEMGATEFETDVQLATDGTMVLCHDPSLARYGHGPLVVEEASGEELLSLDMGSWFSPHLYADERMMTLDDLFTRYGDRIIYHVEIKSSHPDLPGRILGAIQRHGLAESCVVTSFLIDALAAIRGLSPDLRLGWLVKQIDADICARAGELGLFQLCPQASEITPEQMALGRTVVPEIRAWGIAGSSQQVVELIHRVVDLGCDGMTTNWPDWAVHR
jgi:glycerophosphoryl diester phosphodiesterase